MQHFNPITAPTEPEVVVMQVGFRVDKSRNDLNESSITKLSTKALLAQPHFFTLLILFKGISMKFCFLDILTKPKAYITHSSAFLT